MTTENIMTIDGTKYSVVSEKTLEEMKVERPLIAAQMEETGILSHLYLRKPKGKVVFFAVRGKFGISPLSRLCRWS